MFWCFLDSYGTCAAMAALLWTRAGTKRIIIGAWKQPSERKLARGFQVQWQHYSSCPSRLFWSLARPRESLCSCEGWGTSHSHSLQVLRHASCPGHAHPCSASVAQLSSRHISPAPLLPLHPSSPWCKVDLSVPKTTRRPVLPGARDHQRDQPHCSASFRKHNPMWRQGLLQQQLGFAPASAAEWPQTCLNQTVFYPFWSFQLFWGIFMLKYQAALIHTQFPFIYRVTGLLKTISPRIGDICLISTLSPFITFIISHVSSLALRGPWHKKHLLKFLVVLLILHIRPHRLYFSHEIIVHTNQQVDDDFRREIQAKSNEASRNKWF